MECSYGWEHTRLAELVETEIGAEDKEGIILLNSGTPSRESVSVGASYWTFVLLQVPILTLWTLAAFLHLLREDYLITLMYSAAGLAVAFMSLWFLLRSLEKPDRRVDNYAVPVLASFVNLGLAAVAVFL